MRILIITTQYYPVLNPNVYRWAAVAEYWAAKGHEVHVLCSKRSSLPNDEMIQSVHVHRAGQATLLDFVYNLFRFKKRRNEEGDFSPKKISKKRYVFEKIIDWTWRKLYWPDGSCIWYFPAKRKAQYLLKTHKIDAIFSVGFPFTPHLIGMACKKKSKNVAWLMDIEDPFAFSLETKNNNTFLYKDLNFRMEAKALKKADAVSVTLEAAKAKYAYYFGESIAKFTVIPPLFNLKIEKNKKREEGKINISYIGSFYHPIRTPDLFLDLMSTFFTQNPQWFNKIQIHFYGDIPPVIWPTIASYLNEFDNLTPHGLVSRDRIGQIIGETDFLLNISNTTNYHIPSKSIDYWMSGKPIINICQIKDDPFALFFKEYPLFLNLNLGEEGVLPKVIPQLVAYIENTKEKRVHNDILIKKEKIHQTATIANQYLSALGLR